MALTVKCLGRGKESICLQEGSYQFTIYDSASDGIFDPGSYNVTSYGEIIKEGGDFVSSESTLFSIPFVAPFTTCCRLL